MNIFIYLLPLLVFSQLNTYRFYRPTSLLQATNPQVQGVTTNPETQFSPNLSPAPSPSHLKSGTYDLKSASPSPSLSSVPSSPDSTPSVIPPPTPTPPPASGISETDLWNALVAYRAGHSRTQVIREESLCAYARKRVAEHLGKTDLDNHAGFTRDAENGSLFNETGDFTELGEVLAYLPGAQTATQVIEWGWDSSPAHREGLLSNDSTHACIVGTPPFFAGILGHR